MEQYKLLFLGAGSTGKSTIFKQFRELYGRPYDQGHTECSVELNVDYKYNFLTRQSYTDWHKIWTNVGIQNTLKILPRCNHLFEHINEYLEDDYLPSFEDFIRICKPIVSVNRNYFILHDQGFDENYSLFDFGGTDMNKGNGCTLLMMLLLYYTWLVWMGIVKRCMRMN